jgi:hypothetical protein
MQPRTYADDSTRVGLVGSLLTDTALAWFSPLIESSSPLLSNYDAFMAEFAASFGESDRSRVAATQLRQLRQGSRPVAAYAAEFRQLACEVGWGDAALVDAFRYGLREDVKDLLLTLPDAASLSEITAQAVRCDNRLFERRRERLQAVRSNYNPPMAQPASPWQNLTQTPPGALQQLQPSAGDPMQVDVARSGPLSAAEKTRRRRNGLCLYCGQTGHIAATCPAKARRQASASIATLEHGQAPGNESSQ